MNKSNNDNYELKCQSTDDERQLNDKKGQVLISEKKNILKSKNNYDYTGIKKNITFAILSIAFVIIIYLLFNFIIKNLGLNSNDMKGGKIYKINKLKRL